jgi:hypothetical protein
MIKQLIKIIICKIKDHVLITAGACPYTGKSYNACIRCGTMITI